MAVGSVIADPDARLDYGLDWSTWLQTDETITAVAVSSTPSVTIDTTGVVSGTGVIAWVRAPVSTILTFHITTSAGRQDDRSIKLNVKER